MQVARNKSGIYVSQNKYVLDLLKETGMMGCKLAETPVGPNAKISIQEISGPIDRERYQRLVRKLIYLSHTRPDVAFAISRVSQFMHAPTEEQMEAIFRILKYLKGMPGRSLFFKKNKDRIVKVFPIAD